MAQRVRAAELASAARAAIAACEGGALVRAALDGRGGAPWICGAGKAVAGMARGALAAVPSARIGVLVGKHAAAGLPIRVAGHPWPDERGARATDALLAFVAARSPEEEVVFLLSGGASALLCGPRPGLTLSMVRAATERLLRAGAAIAEVNCVRRRLGAALGGGLVRACAARLEVLALSDVIGDDPAAIGSGPATADPTSREAAIAVCRRYGVAAEVIDWLARAPEPPPSTKRAPFRVLANPEALRARAAEAVAAAGLIARVETRLVDGDVEAVAARYAEAARALAPGEVLVAVGEPTVRVMADGRGGRSQQLALLVARAIAGSEACFVAVGSDGTDGPTDAAGAAVDGASWAAARALGRDPEASLAGFDAYPLLDAIGALVRTGPTETNLLDLHLLARG